MITVLQLEYQFTFVLGKLRTEFTSPIAKATRRRLHLYQTQLCLQQPSKLKFLLGCHLATNSFGLGRQSSRQLQILGAMATKMVATWRVVHADLSSFIYRNFVQPTCTRNYLPAYLPIFSFIFFSFSGKTSNI